jgi:hypothetical protein
VSFQRVDPRTGFKSLVDEASRQEIEFPPAPDWLPPGTEPASMGAGDLVYQRQCGPDVVIRKMFRPTPVSFLRMGEPPKFVPEPPLVYVDRINLAEGVSASEARRVAEQLLRAADILDA